MFLNLFKKKFFGKGGRIYFDHASATPVLDIAKKKFLEVSESFANASSIHEEGEKVKEILFEAKKRVAKCIHARQENIHFVSSATEGNNIFIKGVLMREIGEANFTHVIYSESDHSAIVNPIKDTQKVFSNISVSKITPNRIGKLLVEDFVAALNENTKLICFSLVNSEVGTIQEVKKIVQAVRVKCDENNWKYPKVFVDATQAVKFFEIDVHNLLCDGICFGLSKIGGLPGVALLWVKNGVSLAPLLSGGGQEGGVRSGTENLPAIVANSFVLEQVTDRESQTRNRDRVNELRNYFIKELESLGESNVGEKFKTVDPTPGLLVKIFGDTKFKYNKYFENAAPHILLISLKDMLGEELCLRLDAKNISVSPATACSLLSDSGSNFLRSINEPILAKETIRISLGDINTKQEIDYFIKILKEIAKKYCK